MANVALSFARRSTDEFASPSDEFASSPRQTGWDHVDANVKPPVLWNVKYKKRFLCGGAMATGNPVSMFLLWNELIRGSDLRTLGTWLANNGQSIQDMTDVVQSLEAPTITDFFDPSIIDLNSAKRGQHLFAQHCTRCHGVYEKAWDSATAGSLSPSDQLKTVRVDYPDTASIDVHTDPDRYRMGKELISTNSLQIAKTYSLQVVPRTGYVPPPLVGIWARWPYFHNNSAPSLCSF